MATYSKVPRVDYAGWTATAALTGSSPKHAHICGDAWSLRRSHQRKLPLPLRSTTLIAVIVAAFLLVVGLAVLQAYSVRNHGLRQITSNEYVLKYGPTAIFVLLASLWRLVDYHCRILVPWEEMQRGPASPQRSVWLDHLSPLLVVTLYRAIRFSHITVVITIVGFILLKAAALASTGLFFPMLADVGPVPYSVATQRRFDNITGFQRLVGPSSSPDEAPTYNLYAVMERGLVEPEGIAGSVVYESVRPMTEQAHRNSTFRVQSRAFVPDVTCWPLEAHTWVNWTNDNGNRVSDMQSASVTISRPGWSCSMVNSNGNDVQICGAFGQRCPPRQLQSLFQTIACNATQDADAIPSTLLLAGIAEVRYDQEFDQSSAIDLNQSSIPPGSWYVDASPVTAVACNLSHHLEEVELTYNLTNIPNPVISMSRNGKNVGTLAGVTNDLLADATANPVAAANAMFGSDTTYDFVEQPPYAITKMIAAHAHGDYATLFDDINVLKASAEAVFSALVGHVVHYTTSSDTSAASPTNVFEGQLFYAEHRLRVQLVSVVVMVVSLSVLALGSLVLCRNRPIISQLGSTTDIWSTAALLRRSRRMTSYLADLACMNEKKAKRATSRDTFLTRLSSGETIIEPQTAIESFELVESAPVDSKVSRWYSPFSLGKIMLGLTLISPLIIIGLLEYLQRLSNKGTNNLLLRSDTTDLQLSALIRWLPGLLALLVATAYNSLDFNTAVAAAYSKMHGQSVCKEDMQLSLLAVLPPVALFRAVKFRLWGSLATGMAALTGSILTIVTSGLYGVKSQPQQRTIEISVVNEWNTSFHEGTSTDNGTAAVVSLTETVNLSYPLYTYDELAIPMLSWQNEDASSKNRSGTLDLEIPVIRAELVCSEVAQNDIEVTDSMAQVARRQIQDNSGVITYYNKNMAFNISLPENCKTGSAYGNESHIPVSISATLIPDAGNTSYIAKLREIHLGPWDNIDAFHEIGTANLEQPDNQPGCPSILLAWAYFDAQDMSKSSYTAMYCDQKLQKINANVTFEVPSMTIPAHIPPRLDESSASYLSSGSNGETAFWWRLQESMEDSLSIFNKSVLDPYLLAHDPSTLLPDIPNFFRAALFGLTPLPFNTLQKQDRESKEEVFEHLHMFYKRYMAQYASANLRVPLVVDGNAEGSGNSITARTAKRQDNRQGNVVQATYTPGSDMVGGSRPRVVQNETSKTVLQSMLAFMFICAALALSFNTYRGIVLWNPCTVMGMMVLFAGSRWVDDGSEEGHQDESDERRDLARSRVRIDTAEYTPAAGGDGMLMRQAGQRDEWQQGEVTGGSNEHLIEREKPSRDDGALRFRLGWWRNGVYMGVSKGPHPTARAGEGEEVEQVELSKWRYGIDRVR